jgi:hypothetical protein
MRTITINIYKFAELSEKAKETAIEECRYWNTEHNWWDSIYEDAEMIGLKIHSFHYDGSGDIDASLTTEAIKCAESILFHHGDNCETYRLAELFKDVIITKDEFLKGLKREYLDQLIDQWEYLTLDSNVVEFIEQNDYEFYEDGKFYKGGIPKES